jgi:hypothetical protein
MLHSNLINASYRFMERFTIRTTQPHLIWNYINIKIYLKVQSNKITKLNNIKYRPHNFNLKLLFIKY